MPATTKSTAYDVARHRAGLLTKARSEGVKEGH